MHQLPPNAMSVVGRGSVTVLFPKYDVVPDTLRDAAETTLNPLERVLSRFIWLAQNALPVVIQPWPGRPIAFLEEERTFIGIDEEALLRHVARNTTDVLRLAYLGEMLRYFLRETGRLDDALNNGVHMAGVFEGDFEGIGFRGDSALLWQEFNHEYKYRYGRPSSEGTLSTLDLEEVILRHPHTKLADIDDLFLRFQLQTAFNQTSLFDTLTTDHLQALIECGHPGEIKIHLQPLSAIGGGMRPAEDLFCENLAAYLYCGPHAVRPAVQVWIEKELSWMFTEFFHSVNDLVFESPQNESFRTRLATAEEEEEEEEERLTDYERRATLTEVLMLIYRRLKLLGHPAKALKGRGYFGGSGGRLEWSDGSFVELKLHKEDFSESTLRGRFKFMPDLEAAINHTPAKAPLHKTREILNDIFKRDLLEWA